MSARRLPDLAAGPWPATADPQTETLDAVSELVETPWRVVLYDDDIHTFDDVIVQLIRATGCATEQAERHAWTVHTQGKDCVYTGEFFDCFRVQGVLREIQLVTEIEG